jgi:hypothetical protein
MLEIRQVRMGGRVDDFLNVVDSIYRSDPAYVRPLDLELRDRLNPRKNPFFDHGEGTIFVAYRDGSCVGRITAQIDRGHLARYGEPIGFFGFLDTVDDEEIARALLSRAEGWLSGKGMQRVRGPLSLNMNEEIGCLVEGFDKPPYFLSPHHRPYQGTLIEKAGYAKAKDLFSWSYVVGEPNVRVRRGYDEIRSLPEISHRTLAMKTLEKDVEFFVDVYNDSLGDNWGYVPFTRREVQKMAADFRLLLVPEVTCMVSIDGEPAAVALALPNVNEMLRDLRGKLLPLGVAKLIWRLRVEGARSARLIFLGIRKKWRGVRKYAGLADFMYHQMNEGGRKLGMREGELGWTLEDNSRVNAGIRLMGGTIYKRYRLYEKQLQSGAR